MRKFYRWIRSAILTLSAIAGAVCIIIFAASLAFGVKPLNVLSGSMEPGIPTGSMIFSKQVPMSEVAIGDIVTLERPGGAGLITHRVVETTRSTDGTYSVVLKGDANKTADPRPYVASVGQKYIIHVVGLGYVASAFQTGAGWMFLIAIAALLLLLLIFPANEKVVPRASSNEPAINIEPAIDPATAPASGAADSDALPSRRSVHRPSAGR